VPPPIGVKLIANPGQKVGSSGAQLSDSICKAFVEAAKTGDLDKFNYELMTNQIEVRDVVDSTAYGQHLIFTACQAPND